MEMQMQFRGLKYIAAATVVVAGCSGGGTTGGLDVEQQFTVALTAAAEVPTPKPTTASGTADVVVYPDRIDFQLAATNITGITMAHLHSGAVGVAGPVVVTLYNPGTATGAVSGVFVTGTLNSTNLPSGVTLASLKTLLSSGGAYINVHTTANPNGEIRGQLK
jgi:hypothetical protein